MQAYITECCQGGFCLFTRVWICYALVIAFRMLSISHCHSLPLDFNGLDLGGVQVALRVMRPGAGWVAQGSDNVNGSILNFAADRIPLFILQV
jgi:hypothetical protein